MLSWILVLTMIMYGIGSICAQNHTNLNEIVKIVRNHNQSNASNGDTKSLVKLNKDNCSEIEIYKDGINNTSTGHAFHIHISKHQIVRHAGEWDGLCGVVDTYYSSDTTLINKAMKLINEAQIYTVDRKKPLMPSKGTTQINVALGDIQWLELIDSPECRNYKGDFHKLVNLLVELTGGEPDFGGTLVPNPIENEDSGTLIEFH